MKQRTTLQNNALHQYFKELSEALNDSGLDVMTTLKHDIAIPWNPDLVKELMWRPVMQAMTEKFSTTQLDRVEIGHIWEVMNRHLSDKHGIHVEFPHDETDTRQDNQGG